jgi:hypothetical protein
VKAGLQGKMPVSIMNECVRQGLDLNHADNKHAQSVTGGHDTIRNIVNLYSACAYNDIINFVRAHAN